MIRSGSDYSGRWTTSSSVRMLRSVIGMAILETTRTEVQATPLLIVLYLRVSTQDQGREGYSLQEQEAACRRKALELVQEWERTHGPADPRLVVFQDQVSGEFDTEVRDGLDQALALCQSRRVEWMVCMDPDRLGRKAALALSIAEAVEKTGAKLAFVLHEYQMTAEGKLFFTLRASIAEYEKTKILERTNLGKIGARRNRRIPNGVRCYGYDYITRAELDKAGLPHIGSNGVSNQLKINPEEAFWVREIFRWVREERIGPKLIAERLNQMGVPTKRGGRWNRGVIYSMLRNPVYAGRLVINQWDFRGLGAWVNIRREKRPPLEEKKRPPLTPKRRKADEWIDVPVPAIISQSEWDTVQEILADASRLARNRVTDDGRPTRRGHLLSGIARCGICGGTLQYAYNNKIHGYYLRCSNRYPVNPEMPRCPARTIRAEEAEQEVWSTIRAWCEDPDLLRQYYDSRLSSARSATTEQRERVRALEDQLASLQAERDRVNMMFRKGKLSEQDWDQATDEIDAQIRTVERALREAKRGLADIERRDAAVDDLIATLTSMRDRVLRALDTMTLAQRQHLVRTIFRSIRLVAGQPPEYDV